MPTLRNISLTGPYFHDGSVAELSDAVRLMAHHQLGIELTPSETVAIVRWLGTLTGDPVASITPPQLP